MGEGLWSQTIRGQETKRRKELEEKEKEWRQQYLLFVSMALSASTAQLQDTALKPAGFGQKHTRTHTHVHLHTGSDTRRPIRCLSLSFIHTHTHTWLKGCWVTVKTSPPRPFLSFPDLLSSLHHSFLCSTLTFVLVCVSLFICSWRWWRQLWISVVHPLKGKLP